MLGSLDPRIAVAAGGSESAPESGATLEHVCNQVTVDEAFEVRQFLHQADTRY
jgi:hypothetical protein